ncbi:hypothetical protein HZA87_01390 [Candidatus Uhrbacteria bacterium]|nr:hypothetical protein [Candidatus Uhrbacteria bacterium]
MSLNIATINQELKELTEKRALLDQKMEALQKLLGAYRQERVGGKSIVNGASSRSVDIREEIKRVFEVNANQPLQVKDIVEAVAGFRPDIDRKVIANKMVYAVRPTVGLLVKAEYGKYRSAVLPME